MMSKKNDMTKYTSSTQEKKAYSMEKISNVINFFLKIKEVFSIASVVALWVLALWLNYKLAPFVQNDREANFRITAVESDVSSITEDIKVIIQDVGSIKSDTQFIKGKLSQ